MLRYSSNKPRCPSRFKSLSCSQRVYKLLSFTSRER